ncbi:hypothetical protein NMG60_11021576 [Bertholletia excelsa]
MLGNNNLSSPVPSSNNPLNSLDNVNNGKRKRRPAGTPDPDAEVVSLSPKTLLESDRYVCEICNQGFQRDQNLQMHRRRHKVPWKLLKREEPVARKRVFVCPEPTCLHHDPCHALGDLVGIKKHFRRKHSNHKQWVCQKCSKAYAVQSDYKAHLKTCGTRGHSCDCGRVFSRVESFIEHQDACSMGRLRSESQSLQAPALSRTASSPSPSHDNNNNKNSNNILSATLVPSNRNSCFHNLELQLLTTSTSSPSLPETLISPKEDEQSHLQLSIGSSAEMTVMRNNNESVYEIAKPNKVQTVGAGEEDELMRMALEEKANAEEARRQAKRLIEKAEQEFANAKRIRQQAKAELEKAQALKYHAKHQFNSAILQITCHSCRRLLPPHDNHYEDSHSHSHSHSLVLSIINQGEDDLLANPNISTFN